MKVGKPLGKALYISSLIVGYTLTGGILGYLLAKFIGFWGYVIAVPICFIAMLYHTIKIVA